ncbi:YbaK/EbsC protein [Holdemania filiformis DSM 12042]|jgi:Cys-tRNA(Pro)/Cys-tRNA(Cys) deacylase|uniref:Cys-tRNA(Pro)/Cys-tRNA(Cys) deacylase n=2 Tax=Holdemania filiformis TaxID=61171 RepID=B9Y814_9FIRM|nr:YbaK/EbsC protein [Holdemania filiformis DSM 12042]
MKRKGAQAMKEIKTNAMRILDKQKLAYQVHTYPHHDKEAVDGVSVAAMLNEDPAHVYKTLITQASSKAYYVFVIPVAAELDLKKAAKAVNEKAVELIPVKNLLGVSGYIRGGCSPIGMKKLFPTILHQTALEQATIIFSGGQIGTQIEMAPQSLADLIHARFAAVIR